MNEPKLDTYDLERDIKKLADKTVNELNDLAEIHRIGRWYVYYLFRKKIQYKTRED